MLTIHNSTHVRISLESALQYLLDPSHLADFCPNVVAIDNIQRYPQSTHFKWVYKMLGVRFEGRAEISLISRTQIEVLFHEGLRGRLMWLINPDDEGVQISADIDYIVPIPLLQHHEEVEIEAHNDMSLGIVMENLKHKLEARVASKEPIR